MTIEQKARAYDEALEIARDYYKANIKLDKADENLVLEDIFLELKESKDEQNRKWILEYLYDGLRKTDEQFKGQFKCAIAWLEKQAERKTPQWMIDFLDNYRRMIGCSLDYDEARDVDGKILCIKEWLEKQGVKAQGKTALEAIKEEKVDNANKLETKFHEGEWIVDNQGLVHQIERLLII